MPWYRSGTVNVTNNSTSVVGNGTNWTQAVEVGEAFYGPDSKVYEIANVVSDTQLTLATPYQGGTAAGQSYVIIPSQSYIRELAAEAAALVANYGATMSTVGAGRFADGTVTAPGIRFTADDDTGVRRTGSNALALVAGGADRVAVTTSGATVTGALTVSGTTTTATLVTTGNTTLGDAAGDSLTITGTAVSIPNNLNFDANTLFIDAANNRVGIGTATPTNALSVAGNFNVTGNTTLGDASTDTLTVHPNAVTWQNNPTHSGNHAFSGNVTVSGKLTTAAPAAGGAGFNLPHGAAPTTPSNGDVWTTTSGVFARVNGATKTVAFTDSSITGNAATATTLQTARTINGTSFNGSANITTANWGTARTITVGNTGKSFDGSANVSWSLAEIGAAAASTTVNLSGDQTITGIKTFTVSPVVPEPTADNHAATALYVSRSIADLVGDPSKIIGLVQVATGGGAGTYARIGGSFAPKTTDAAFFNNHPIYAGIVEQTIDGQSMIRVPKFWFKAGIVPGGAYAGKAYWMISDLPVAGFSVHPAFIGAGGVELDQIWVGKYQASSSGGKLQSVPGVSPRVSMDFPTARAEAYARNTGGVSGFRLWSYYDLAAIQMLASIEMGGLDMQSLIGQGRVSQSSAANVDASDVAQATWRGIVGLWGNVWQMVDGLKRNGGNWWRWQYNVPGNTTTSDFATGYVNTGRAALTTSGYPVTFDTTLLSAGIIVPATVDGTASNGSTGDYFWSNTNTDDRIAYHGGAWDDGAAAGLFCLFVYRAPSYADGSLGARLAKV